MTFVEMKKKRGMKRKDAESGENWRGPCSAGRQIFSGAYETRMQREMLHRAVLITVFHKEFFSKHCAEQQNRVMSLTNERKYTF